MMLEDNLKKQNDFFHDVFCFIQNQKLSHAYLVETRGYIEKEEVIKIFARLLYYTKNSNIESFESISDNQLTSIDKMIASGNYIEVSSDTIIKKDQVLEVQDKFMTKSWDNEYRIYVIYEADKLNKQAANSLLKFIEEPEDGIIAILVADNRYQLLETIRSRCQILSLKNQKVDIKFESIDFLTDLIHTLETKKEASIAHFPIICQNEYYTKDRWRDIFLNLELIYEQALRKLVNAEFDIGLSEILDYIIKYNSETTILYKIDVLSNFIEKLNYNLNVNLMLDQFIISFSGGDFNA